MSEISRTSARTALWEELPGVHLVHIAGVHAGALEEGRPIMLSRALRIHSPALVLELVYAELPHQASQGPLVVLLRSMHNSPQYTLVGEQSCRAVPLAEAAAACSRSLLAALSLLPPTP